jgi:hypothetical protein
MAEEKKNKYTIKEGCRLGFCGKIYEGGRTIELTSEQSKQLSEYIEPQTKEQVKGKKQNGVKK